MIAQFLVPCSRLLVPFIAQQLASTPSYILHLTSPALPEPDELASSAVCSFSTLLPRPLSFEPPSCYLLRREPASLLPFVKHLPSSRLSLQGCPPKLHFFCPRQQVFFHRRQPAQDTSTPHPHRRDPHTALLTTEPFILSTSNCSLLRPATPVQLFNPALPKQALTSLVHIPVENIVSAREAHLRKRLPRQASLSLSLSLTHTKSPVGLTLFRISRRHATHPQHQHSSLGPLSIETSLLHLNFTSF